MLLIPAIDLRNGRCVRLFQGRFETETVYSEDPEGTARRWREAGARLLHVVDLDAASGKSHDNRDAVARIIRAAAIPVQVGGGLRDAESVRRLLAQGAERAILGTAACDPQLLSAVCREHPGRILVGIDALEGRVAVHGWTRQTEIPAVDLARRAEDCGAAGIVFTDIARDGTRGGPNLAATRLVAEAVSIPVIASGGVGSLDHLRALLALQEFGVVGVICGKALYSGAIDFREALAVLGEP
ncbi:MAG: 1-(5-phosphoribosyl)-5-[(5-phosphoribosylamino)methylideneamino]imidazole-4-carboxamide isomerase [Desulfobacterales bacterium]